jgi:hypothetical protein
VINIDRTAHRVGVGKHIRRVMQQQQMFPQTGRDLIGIDRDMSGGQIDHRLQTDAAAVTQQRVQPAQ